MCNSHRIKAVVCGTGECHDVHIKCEKPSWERVCGCYNKQTREKELATVDPEKKAFTGVRCISCALLDAGMQWCFNNTVLDKDIREKGFFDDAVKLKDWLLGEDVWRGTTAAGKWPPDGEVSNEMNRWNGVIIIEKGKGNSGCAALWKNGQMTGDEIMDGDNFYFWGLEKCAVNVDDIINLKTTTDAGHGDKAYKGSRYDPGTGEHCGTDYEKDFALLVEERVDYWLSEFGIDNQRTRFGDHERAPGEEQVTWRHDKANDNGSRIFVSIHLDNHSSKMYYILYKDDDNNIHNKELADFIHQSMLVLTPSSRPVRPKNKPIGVLDNFNGEAAVLIELGGICNEETKRSIRDHFSDIGQGIAKGMYKYLFNGEEPKIKE